MSVQRGDLPIQSRQDPSPGLQRGVIGQRAERNLPAQDGQIGNRVGQEQAIPQQGAGGRASVRSVEQNPGKIAVCGLPAGGLQQTLPLSGATAPVIGGSG